MPDRDQAPRVIVDESGNDAAELGRRSNRPGRVDHDDEVRLCRNSKGVGCAPKCCSETDDSGIAKIVLAQVSWIVAVQICRTFNVASTSGGSIDRDFEARRGSASIVKFERLKALLPRETTAGTRLSAASAWLTVTADRSAWDESFTSSTAGPRPLVRAARARWYGNMDSLAAVREVRFRSNSISVPQAKLAYVWSGMAWSLSHRIDSHVRIIRAVLYDISPRRACCQRCRDSRGISATVVLQLNIQINALVAIDDAITVPS